jgi:hypothetical protein
VVGRDFSPALTLTNGFYDNPRESCYSIGYGDRRLALIAVFGMYHAGEALGLHDVVFFIIMLGLIVFSVAAWIINERVKSEEDQDES